MGLRQSSPDVPAVQCPQETNPREDASIGLHPHLTRSNAGRTHRDSDRRGKPFLSPLAPGGRRALLGLSVRRPKAVHRTRVARGAAR